MRSKVIFLLMAAVKLARVSIGDLREDDRDDYAIKRVDDPGMLCALLYRQLFRSFLKSLTLQIHRATEAGREVNIMDAITHRRMTSGFRYAFTTGMWGIQSSQCGVVQLMTRQTILASISHRRRINTPVNRDGKLQKPRELSDSHYGIVCPVETPEGQSCGLVENLAMLAVVSIGSDGSALARLLVDEGYIRRDLLPIANHWLVLVNGVYEGTCPDGLSLCEALRSCRRSSGIPASVSVYSNEAERTVFVDSDAGALHQPLVRVQSLDHVRRILRCVPAPLVWKRLVSEGCVEILTKMEEKNVRIGVTHIHIHPSCMFGVCGGQIPFPDHNQAPRNIYGSAMTKQAVGVFVSEPDERFDCQAHVLHYPQVPLVQTMLQDVQGADAAPCGINVVLAILSHTGFSQEDAIVVNRDAVERGLFHSSIYRSYRDEERDSTCERFGTPAARGTQGLRHSDYSKLESDGFPAIGAVLSNGDAVIGKTTTRGERGVTQTTDASTFLKSFEDMRVDKVCLTSGKSGTRLARVRMHASRSPQVGDKFSSHHGQKGVIGLLVPGADMPFARDGWCPDMMICPFCIPSRMTFGQLIEMLLGKAACFSGLLGDGTPFEGVTVEEIGKVLEAFGYESRGNETLYNGTTGERFETSVFVGPCHYQRLKHMVTDKVHARSYGPRNMLTRQPVEGRSRMGGARVGEMEKDCFASHGASSTLLDRLMRCSDEFRVPVCARCGMIAERIADDAFAISGRRNYCRGCRGGEVVMVRCPYAFKLFVQEVAALNICMRLAPALDGSV
jgi:DNA-directed RNA polymerase II subunit RPB2